MDDALRDVLWRDAKVLYEAIGLDAEKIPKQRDIICALHAYRYVLLCGGVGASKSFTAAQAAWPRMLEPAMHGAEPTPRYWLVGENFDIPRTEFDYILQAFHDFGVPVPVINSPKEGRWEMKVPGVCLVETKSWTNPDSLHSRPVQGMIICEAGLLPANMWYERLRPRLGRVPGSWVIMAGTLEDSGPFFKDLVRDVVIEQKVSNWYGRSIATWENVFTYPSGLENEEIKELRRTTPPDIFKERYGAIPKAVAALVFREFSHTFHVGDYKFDKHRPVYLGIDPAGIYAVNAFQVHGRDVYIVGEVHLDPGTSERAIEEVVGRPWWKNVTHGVMDATQVEPRETWTSGAIWDALEKEPVPIRHQKVSVEGGIELIRSFLHSGSYDKEETPPEDIWEFQGKSGVSRLHVDASCTNTIFEFAEGYRRKKLRSGEYSEEVVKRHDHHVDLTRYFLADQFGFTAPSRPAARAVARRWRDSRPTAMP